MPELLEPIIDYNMPILQAKAYKIGLIWIELSRKLFPDYKHVNGYPKRGDPRKSSLFRFCYKLVRETQGLVPDNEYRLFIKAQLQMLKALDLGQGVHPRIDPGCLVSDKAWIRWKMWKRKYDQIAKRQTKEDTGLDMASEAVVYRELMSTKKFLEGRFDDLEEECFMTASRDIERYIALGKISGYYALLSPWVKRHCKLTIDLKLYDKSITPDIIAKFREIFPNEDC